MNKVGGGAGTREASKISRGNRGVIYSLNQPGGISSTCLRLAFDVFFLAEKCQSTLALIQNIRRLLSEAFVCAQVIFNRFLKINPAALP